jgi:protocatechuate 3,4-dioxygenase beta subunit
MKQYIGYRSQSPGSQPPHLYEPYASSHKRAPLKPPIALPAGLSELTGPRFAGLTLPESASDLTAGHKGQPLGERIIVRGRVLDDDGKPVPDALIEIWQCNAAGRYLHAHDQHDAPIDPNFTGAGRARSDAQGRFCFKTIRPGAYPWRNHVNAWRPAHIHFSLFGAALATRLVTQMYFPNDPLLDFDPIFQSVPDASARQRLVSAFDWETTVPEVALGYRFDIVLRGRLQTPWEVSP